MIAKVPHWLYVNIGSDNGLVPSCKKPFPEPLLTYIAIYMASQRHNVNDAKTYTAYKAYKLHKIIQNSKMFFIHISDGSNIDHDYSGPNYSSYQQKGSLIYNQSCYFQDHNAKQLPNWCLHFIARNYARFKSRPEFSSLKEEDRIFVEEHQWPPLSYQHDLAQYRAAQRKCNVMW